MSASKRAIIHSNSAPEALGPYSQAIVAGGVVYCSGQVGMDPATGQVVSGGVAEQTEQVLRNLEAVLTEAGASFGDVAKCGVFLANMDDFSAMNEVYATRFGEALPARATVEVSRLPKNVLVEIDAIAVLPTQ